MIIIVDYGMGNLRSVQKAFERIRVPARVSGNINDIQNAEKVLIPGVGHFAKGMQNLKERGLLEVLNEVVIVKKKPVLGICLGMQLMTGFSEEGNCPGFGWISGSTKKFLFTNRNMKIPHMGWNNLEINNDDFLYNGITSDNFFYFVHSYYVSCDIEIDIIAKTNYGIKFVSSFQKENIFGCQFHPEKSHDAGLKILSNFIKL